MDCIDNYVCGFTIYKNQYQDKLKNTIYDADIMCRNQIPVKYFKSGYQIIRTITKTKSTVNFGDLELLGLVLDNESINYIIKYEIYQLN